jgi:predicted nuclease with TOPRIM domain
VRRRQRNAELEQRLGELQAATERADELGTAATTLRTALERTRDDAASRIAELEGRVAELESALAARENELNTALASAREEAARIQMEKAALQEAHDVAASRNADLEERLKDLDAANARATQLERQLEETATQITHLEAGLNNVLAVTQVPGQERRGGHPDGHAEDLSHLLFVPGPQGYRLVARDGPPPMPGAMLELPQDDGTSSRLLVSKVGLAPLPGGSVACAYLVAAE